MLAEIEAAFCRLLIAALAESRSAYPCPQCGMHLDRKLRCDQGCGRRWAIITNAEGDVLRWQEVGR